MCAGQWSGGVIGRQWGVTGPFWFAFVGSAVFVVVIWRELRHIAHGDEDLATVPEAGTEPTPA